MSNPYDIKDPQSRIESDSDLVNEIRKQVSEWRNDGYMGASKTSKKLLAHWFKEEHDNDFKYFFSQREAVETVIYLFEVLKLADSENLLSKFNVNVKKISDETGEYIEATSVKIVAVKTDSKDVDTEKEQKNRKRYYYKKFSKKVRHLYLNYLKCVIKAATGSGKTKIISMLIVWSYFHSRYENSSLLGKHILLVAPNLIVKERLLKDFDGGAIFRQDPLIPKEWELDFGLYRHVYSNSTFNTRSNYRDGCLIVTNIHSLYSKEIKERKDIIPLYPNYSERIGEKELSSIIRHLNKISDHLVVFNDEGHHLNSRSELKKWDEAMRDLKNISLRVDLSATPKDREGYLFPDIVTDYKLKEAIEDNIVKKPQIIKVKENTKYSAHDRNNILVTHRDHIHAALNDFYGQNMKYAQKRHNPILLIVTQSRADIDRVKDYLIEQNIYRIDEDQILSIHATCADQQGVEELKKRARELDEDRKHKYQIVISCDMLNEGWDIRSVISILALRALSASSNILPEQILGRGLRRLRGGKDNYSRSQYLRILEHNSFYHIWEENERELGEIPFIPPNTEAKPEELNEIFCKNRDHNMVLPYILTNFSCVDNLKYEDIVVCEDIPPISLTKDEIAEIKNTTSDQTTYLVQYTVEDYDKDIVVETNTAQVPYRTADVKVLIAYKIAQGIQRTARYEDLIKFVKAYFKRLCSAYDIRDEYDIGGEQKLANYIGGSDK